MSGSVGVCGLTEGRRAPRCFSGKGPTVNTIDIDTNWEDDNEPTLVLPQADLVDIAMACDRVTLPYFPAELLELDIEDAAEDFDD